MEFKQLWHNAQKMMKSASSLEDQTAVHRKKFEFMFSQMKNLFSKLNEKIGSYEDNCDNRAAMTNICNQIQELNELVSKNTLQTWSETTINYHCNYVMKKLMEILTEIFTNVRSIDPELAKTIEPESPEWENSNTVDLRAIHASFTQFLRLDKLDPFFAPRVQSRLDSIDKELERSHTDCLAEFSPIPSHYHKWIVDYSDFEEVKEIGGGVSAIVYYGKDKRTGQEVAIKKFKFRKLNGSRLQSFQREVAVLAMANHPALLKLVGITDKLPFCIIMEWMPNHSLYHDLHVYHHLDQTGKTIALFDIARGMQFLHSRQIVHRDLKSLNVLLDANDKAKICDFGFSRHASDATFMQQSIGTPHWMAPEVLQRNAHYTSKIDVYAFGILTWEVATGHVPYAGMDSQSIVQQVLSNDIRPPLPTDLNPQMRDLITMCWERDPALRPTFDTIVRILSTGDILFNGASKEQFLEYVASTAITEEQLNKDVKLIIESMRSGETPFAQGTKKLREKGIPTNLLEDAWSVVEKGSPNEIPEFASLFFGTSFKGKAAALLRTFKAGEVPQHIAAMLVEELPTEDEKIDIDITCVACKNGAADLCAIYSTHPKEIAIALDVAASTGVDLTLKAAVDDCCVRALSSNEDYLIAAAVRCLISLDCATRVHKTSLQSMLQGGNLQLRSLAFVAMAAAKRTDPELLSHSISNWLTDRCAALHVISVAGEKAASNLIIEDLRTRTKEIVTQELRAILKLAKLPSVAPQIAEIIKKRGFSTLSPEEEQAVSVLKSKLNIV